MNDKWTHLKDLGISIRWHGYATDPVINGELMHPDGRLAKVTRHTEMSVWEVANGPLTAGRTWYTIEGSTVEYGKLADAVSACFPTTN